MASDRNGVSARSCWRERPIHARGVMGTCVNQSVSARLIRARAESTRDQRGECNISNRNPPPARRSGHRLVADSLGIPTRYPVFCECARYLAFQDSRHAKVQL